MNDASPAPVAPGNRKRIVVINDDTAFLRLMESLLEELEGYQVSTRTQWDGAYEYVKEQLPDIVILDIVMGSEERGWTILNLLTLDPITYAIPVIVCSAAVTSLRDHGEYLQRHGIHAIAKPFDLDTLVTAVAEALAKA